jgi:hypothetical protein
MKIAELVNGLTNKCNTLTQHPHRCDPFVTDNINYSTLKKIHVGVKIEHYQQAV